ncbi:threonine dehydrogenase-like Zn-dependent dehydrogenase [Nakamurella sp. UYEF19]
MLKLVLVGLTDKPVVIKHGTRFSYLQQQILGHYGPEPDHLEQIVGLVGTGRLDFARSVSEVLPLTEAATAVEHLRRKVGNPIRIVLVP